MNLVELDRALRQLRLSGMASVLETRLRHAQTEHLAPLDFEALAELDLCASNDLLQFGLAPDQRLLSDVAAV